MVEWGEGFAEGLAGERLEVHIDRSTSAAPEAADVRRVRVSGVGARWDEVDLRETLSA